MSEKINQIKKNIDELLNSNLLIGLPMVEEIRAEVNLIFEQYKNNPAILSKKLIEIGKKIFSISFIAVGMGLNMLDKLYGSEEN